MLVKPVRSVLNINKSHQIQTHPKFARALKRLFIGVAGPALISSFFFLHYLSIQLDHSRTNTVREIQGKLA